LRDCFKNYLVIAPIRNDTDFKYALISVNKFYSY